MLKHVMLRPFAEQLSALGQSESEEDAPEHLPEPMAFRLHICLVFTLTASTNALTRSAGPEPYLGPPGAGFSPWTTSAEPTETVPVLPQRPARFSLTDAEKEKCAGPVMPGKLMYLTPLGSSLLGGQWGSWQLTDDPDSPVTASWQRNFMSTDWESLHISGTGRLATARPSSAAELEQRFQWRGTDDVLGGAWGFVEEAMAPILAMKYDGMNYSIGREPDSFPPTYTASPRLNDSALPSSEWRHWSVVDCEGSLAAVLLVEITDGTRAGRMKIYNANGEKAAEALPDALLARLHFVDVNQRLLATAGSPSLTSELPMQQLPTRSSLGQVLPYQVAFERGGYDLSSDLISRDFRWILGAAVQVRALQDADREGFTPPFVKDHYFLLAVVLALALIILLAVGTIFTSSLRTASRIFFYREKTGNALPLP